MEYAIVCIYSDMNSSLIFWLCLLLQREREMRMNSGGAMGLGGKCLFFPFPKFETLLYGYHSFEKPFSFSKLLTQFKLMSVLA